jgi:glycosyltransferase involved in cell wall biosynthesis
MPEHWLSYSSDTAHHTRHPDTICTQHVESATIEVPFRRFPPHIRRSFQTETRAIFYDIDNPVSDAFFSLDPEHEIPGQLLSVGPIRTIKRPDRALAALALAVQQEPGLQLHFAGARTETALYREMQKFIAAHRLEGHVRFLGRLNQAQILECYQNASVFLLTSDLETAPMALEQALAAGKPAVVTDVGGTRYLVDHGRSGYVIARSDTPGLADAVVKLTRDNALRREFGNQARQTALTRFNSDVVAAKVYAMYQQILADLGPY